MDYICDGGCHCGNLRYQLSGPVPVSDWSARSCGCDFCTRHGGLYAAHPGAAMTVTQRSANDVGRYRFATASADFCFCKVCGVLVYLTSEIDGQLYGLVNMNTLDERPAAFADAPVMSYEGENRDARLLRRRANWIARVRVETA